MHLDFPIAETENPQQIQNFIQKHNSSSAYYQKLHILFLKQCKAGPEYIQKSPESS